ncbi:TIR domain-containing protein [Streptomyces fumanus]|uniref:TIR domain-containing protein n=1 Tax=Streptomyces fumanus TaxID=67302 RepID=A0A919AMP1_9ACTN|nr:TIR domain-containing protein [Streptomyces fumanus]GHF17229.1 hypothetical protein GCM10018772_48100 [Streptomyces fumanus]
MHEIFLNYRTKGGREVAHLCAQALSARFGTDSVFLAGRSIDLGEKMDVLLRTARRSEVLLALIDEGWLTVPDRKRPARRALDNPDDWVRREIEAALDAGTLVVPVFVGRGVEQLDPRRLPGSIAEIAEYQYARVHMSSIDTDLARLGDRLARQLPALAALDGNRSPGASGSGAPEAAAVRTDRQSGGIGNVAGSVETYINDTHAPLHAGRGDQHNGPRFDGDGTNYVAGDNHGGIRQGFGTRTPRGGERK